MLIAVAGAGIFAATNEETPPPKPDIPLDAWVPYWALDASLAEFDQRVRRCGRCRRSGSTPSGSSEIVVNPNASAELTAQFMDKAKSADVELVPSIVEAMPAGGMAAMLADPTTRARHVEAIRAFAEQGGFDGIDIDYEQFAFADGRDTWATTRPRLGGVHRGARGRTARRRSHADREYPAGVRRRPDTRERVLGVRLRSDRRARRSHPHHGVRLLGGRARPDRAARLGGVDDHGSDRGNRFTGQTGPRPSRLRTQLARRNIGECPASEVQGRTAVSARSVDELVELRQAQPMRVDETGEWMFEYDLEVTDGVTSCVQTRQVHYVDGDGIRLRMDLARTVSPRRRGALGVRLRRRIRVGCDPAHRCRSDGDNPERRLSTGADRRRIGAGL